MQNPSFIDNTLTLVNAGMLTEETGETIIPYERLDILLGGTVDDGGVLSKDSTTVDRALILPKDGPSLTEETSEYRAHEFSSKDSPTFMRYMSHDGFAAHNDSHVLSSVL